MQIRSRLWIGVGVSILAGGALAGPAQAGAAAVDMVQLAHNHAGDGAAKDAHPHHHAPKAEGGEGGEGGEAGVDPAAAAADPAVFLIALDVIAAHYHAGRDAYKAGAHQAAGEMFAHPIAEIYADLEEVFQKQGIAPFLEEMSLASELALAGKPEQEVTAAADTVLNTLRRAARKAPKSEDKPLVVEVRVLAEMIDRAAQQFGPAAKSEELEHYLDGYGFYMAARDRFESLRPQLLKADAEVVKQVAEVLDRLAAAYPQPLRPATLTGEPGELLAASSVARLALGRVG